MQKKGVLPGQEQESSKSNNNNIVLKHNKLIDIPDTLPGCFGEFPATFQKSLFYNCELCDVKIVCARASNRSD